MRKVASDGVVEWSSGLMGAGDEQVLISADGPIVTDTTVWFEGYSAGDAS